MSIHVIHTRMQQQRGFHGISVLPGSEWVNRIPFRGKSTVLRLGAHFADRKQVAPFIGIPRIMIRARLTLTSPVGNSVHGRAMMVADMRLLKYRFAIGTFRVEQLPQTSLDRRVRPECRLQRWPTQPARSSIQLKMGP
ncbi:hypothetical protein A9P79_01240 [Cupriavidus taiwanensis]|nr:hypothetical protein A9P79_01240 [Cupriavidus taiwanensis]